MFNKPPQEGKRDMILLIVVLVLILVGTVMVFSSSHRLAEVKYNDSEFFLRKQLCFLLAGITLMFVFNWLPLQKMRAYIYPVLAVLGVLLACVFFPQLGGKSVNGAARWLGIGGFSLQVSELLKLTAVIFLADHLSQKTNLQEDSLRGLLVPLLILSPLLALVLLQPDYGNTAVIVAVSLVMVFLAGVKKRYLLIIGVCIMVAGVSLILLSPYRLERVLTFMTPLEHRYEGGYQLTQSLMSFGSGGPLGVGLGDGMQKLYFLPEAHTDFIFSIIAEETGLIGVAAVLFVFCVVIYRGMLIALKSTDRFYSLLAAGITLLISAQAIINIGCAMGLLPTKGLVLPFVSYGGTAFLVNMIAVGILLNISMYNEKKSLTSLLRYTFRTEGRSSWKR
ncbi:MAG: putative lipid II flippase FtsW [Deltaproteobacteria bacterium]|nr:putative lipid II flippase FtsW [Deltaproteobacteria bacterium]